MQPKNNWHFWTEIISKHTTENFFLSWVKERLKRFTPRNWANSQCLRKTLERNLGLEVVYGIYLKNKKENKNADTKKKKKTSLAPQEQKSG